MSPQIYLNFPFILVPGKAPRIHTAYNTSSTSLYISWYPIPRAYHNGRLLGYRVFYKDETMRNDSHYDNITLGPIVDRINITGLRKHKTYVVQVAGFNKKGEGAPSKGVLVTTDQDGKILHVINHVINYVIT